MLQTALLGGALAAATLLVIAFVVPRPVCSKCGERFPRMRAPSSGREVLLGGHTCRKCGQRCDRKGRPIAG